MSWLAIATLALNIFNTIASYIHDKQLLSAGEQAQLSERAQEILVRVSSYAKIDTDIGAMSADSIHDRLHAEFERKPKA